MSNYDIEPWPSTYDMQGEVKPEFLTSKFNGRVVGAFRSIIPPKTMEPPQVHLIAERDGRPFEELLTGFDKDFLVVFYDPETHKKMPLIYHPGENIVIPSYQIHWLVNKHDSGLAFTCECSPFPWNEDDEPEFRNLPTLLQYLEKNGLTQRLI